MGGGLWLGGGRGTIMGSMPPVRRELGIIFSVLPTTIKPIEAIRPKVRSRVLVIHTDNFTCEDASPGIERTFLALAELMQQAGHGHGQIC